MYAVAASALAGLLLATGCVVSSTSSPTAERRAPASAWPAVSLERPTGAVELGRVEARAWLLAGPTACQVRMLDDARELGADVLVVDAPGVSPCKGVAFARR